MSFWDAHFRMQLLHLLERPRPTMESIMEYGLRAQISPDNLIQYLDIFGNEKWAALKREHGLSESSESSDDDIDWDKESDAQRKARLLLDEKKAKEKAEKKRLKKKRQKDRKRLEKELNKTDSETNNGDKDVYNFKEMASALNSESSDCSSDVSNDEEGLDLKSSFVTKAAEIAKRKLEQKQENKKKSPVKEDQKTPEKKVEKTDDDTAQSSSKMEDFVKLSANYAMIGNKLAGAGDFKMAAQYFTEAIKYNPTEFKLFGNRAFCFEKMQEFEKSLSDAELSLSMSPGWVKGHFRKGRALAGLKRFEEAAAAFKEILEQDVSRKEAAQELLDVQTLQLMECGFTRDQSSKALVIYGSVEKAQEGLSNLNKVSPPVLRQQVVNATGLSPGLSAKAAAASATATAAALPPPAPDASKSHAETKPLISVQTQQSQAKADAPVAPNQVRQPPELFPVWVGNLSISVTEPLLGNLFNKVGRVHSIKQLSAKHCAFINYTQRQHCEEAIRRYHGFELKGAKLMVRYPDRLPSGMNISRAAQLSADVCCEDLGFYYNNAARNGHHYYKYREPYY
ncbi:unnamed protein product [Knipowitschia caucasica]|uniref:RRM domain-containing protein n=1 Tax=Knipowitschia caucasica TaxID=637954 RepID=A0AAV2KN18_KNICA